MPVLPRFKNPALFENAFIHRSYLNEHPECNLPSNERLEFLGDSVLQFLTSEFLYDTYQNEPEGRLTAYRSALVKTEMLAELSKSLEFGEFLKLSRGEEESGGRGSEYILADAFEAFLGALYIDQGLKKCQTFLKKHLFPLIIEIIATKSYRDYKSHFQETAQEKLGITPHYKVLEEWGPDHAKRFRVGVFVQSKEEGIGEGPSKQKAEVDAARNALHNLGWLEEEDNGN